MSFPDILEEIEDQEPDPFIDEDAFQKGLRQAKVERELSSMPPEWME